MKTFLRALLPVIYTLVLLLPAVYVCFYLVEGVYEVPMEDASFRFERFWAVLLLPAALAVLAARGWLQRDQAPRLRISRGADIAKAGTGFRPWLRDVLTALRTVAVTLMVIALMGPQSIHARDSAEVRGIDIVLTLDLSLSMQAADIAPNRFEAMQHVVDDFIMRRPNDRIGAVVFGREAYTLLPLTTDKDALRNVIRELELGVLDGRGTAIGNAVGVSLNRLRRSTARSKVIILLTDGDSNSGNISPDQAAEFAATMGVKVYAILMGAQDDARIQRGVDLFGRPLFGTGNYPVNPELLQQMAQRSGGEFYPVTDRESLVRSFHSILDRLERTEIEDPGRMYGELFPAFLWPAFALLGIEALLGMLLLRRWP